MLWHCSDMVTQLTEDSLTVDQIVQDSSIVKVNIEVLDPITGELHFLITCSACCDNEKRRVLEDVLNALHVAIIQEAPVRPWAVRLTGSY